MDPPVSHDWSELCKRTSYRESWRQLVHAMKSPRLTHHGSQVMSVEEMSFTVSWHRVLSCKGRRFHIITSIHHQCMTILPPCHSFTCETYTRSFVSSVTRCHTGETVTWWWIGHALVVNGGDNVERRNTQSFILDIHSTKQSSIIFFKSDD